MIVKPRVRIQSDSNANRYTVRPEDAGKYIQVEVIGINYDCGETVREGPDAGKAECRYSEGHGWSTTFGPIAGSVTPPPPPPPPPAPPAVAPTYTALPEITGDAEDMQTLTVSNGTWSGTAPLAYAYQWQRCSKANAGCKPIEGATAATYTLTAADIATRLTVIVTVSNRGGQFVAAAKLTPKVVGAKPREGHDSLDVAQLLPRHKLKLQSIVFTPARLRPGGRWVARVTIGDHRGFLIKGVDVTVGDELGDVTSTPVLTDDRGARDAPAEDDAVRSARPARAHGHGCEAGRRDALAHPDDDEARRRHRRALMGRLDDGSPPERASVVGPLTREAGLLATCTPRPNARRCRVRA